MANKISEQVKNTAATIKDGKAAASARVRHELPADVEKILASPFNGPEAFQAMGPATATMAVLNLIASSITTNLKQVEGKAPEKVLAPKPACFLIHDYSKGSSFLATAGAAAMIVVADTVGRAKKDEALKLLVQDKKFLLKNATVVMTTPKGAAEGVVYPSYITGSSSKEEKNGLNSPRYIRHLRIEGKLNPAVEALGNIFVMEAPKDAAPAYNQLKSVSVVEHFKRADRVGGGGGKPRKARVVDESKIAAFESMLGL